MHARKRLTEPSGNAGQSSPVGRPTGDTTRQARQCLFCRYRRTQAQGKETSNA